MNIPQQFTAFLCTTANEKTLGANLTLQFNGVGTYHWLHQSHKQHPLFYYNQFPRNDCNSQELTEKKIHERDVQELRWYFKLAYSISCKAQYYRWCQQETTKYGRGSQIKPLPRLTANTLRHSKPTKLVRCFTEPLHLIPYTAYTVKNVSSTSSHHCTSSSGQIQ